MNHIHQTIWNKTLGTWIVASELAKRGKKSGSQQRSALMLPLLLFASTGLALPTGNQLVEGSVTVTKPSTVQMQINQSSQRAIVNWQSFSIAGQESVNIQQPNTSAALLNRVVGQDASAIQGRLNANGQVYLINPNGVIFSKTAQVDVGGLVASTHAISNKDFLNGNQHFTAGNALGKVINHGQIKTPEGGIVALIGEQVENTGHISTPKGATVLAAGKTVDLDMQGDGLVEVKISEAAINAQINNQGIIQADGGQVLMTAKAAGQLLKTVINNQGIVEARGLVEKNGKIVLSGGDNGVVQVSGTLDASGSAASNTQGGDIKVGGQQIHINENATLNADSAQTDKPGNIQLVAQQDITLAAGSKISANNSQGDAGVVHIESKSGTTLAQGTIEARSTHSASSTTGKGGSIELLGERVGVLDKATINASGENGGGKILVGGDYQGKNPDVNNAKATYIGKDTNLIADAINHGDGGKVIAWSDEATRAYGNISAQGGNLDGNGGFIETSGHWLDTAGIRINASSPNGQGGNWLLDPFNITIDGTGPTTTGPSFPNWTAGANNSVILNTDINSQLDAGTSVTITTYDSGTSLGTDVGNISVNAQISGTTPTISQAGATLTLQANNTINLNSPITASTIRLIGANGISFGVSSSLTASGTGDAIVLDNGRGSFINNAGATALNAPNGRWLVFAADPSSVSKNGLTSAFRQYSTKFDGFLGAVESRFINGVGNGFIYASAPRQLIVNTTLASGAASNTFGTAPTAVFGYAIANPAIADNEDLAAISGTATFTPTISSTTAVGSFSISYAGGLSSAVGYTFATGRGLNYTVDPATLTLTYTANPSTRVYGAANPIFTGTVTGFVNNDTLATATSGTLSFTSAANSSSNVGTYAINGSGLTLTSGNYIFSQATGNATALVITPATLTYTANPSSRLYGEANPVFTGTVTGFANNDTLATATAGTASFTSTADNLSNVGNYAITGSGLTLTSGNYIFSQATGNATALDITPATLTYTANPSSRLYGEANPVFTGTVTGFANNDTLATATAGTASFTSTADNLSNVGNYAITGSGLSTNNGNYTFNQATGNATALGITPATLTYTANPSSRLYGAANPVFTGTVTGFANADTLATATTGTASFTSTADNLSNVGNYAILGSGLSANHGNYLFTQATGNATALDITPATLTYTANPSSRLYGAANPVFTGTVTGFANNDTLASATTGPASFTSTADNLNNVGNYAIIGSGLSANNGNYTFNQATGNATALGITPATLTYTANPSSRLYSATNPLFTGAVTGFANADTLATATTGTASFTSTADNLSNVGNYAIIGSGLSANNGNYTFNQATGNATALGITPATLTYTANPSSRLYGAANPLFTGAVTGFVNNDTLATATTGTASFTSTADNLSNVGNYAITGSGLSANHGNYLFSQATGNATALGITPATLTYTANPSSRLYGAANPVFTGSVTGFANADTLATATTGTASFTSTTDNLSNVGNYTITGSGLSANHGNYNFTQAAGNANALTITPALLSVTANNDGKDFDGVAYSGGNGIRYAGFVNDETPSVLTGTISYGGNSQRAINPGAYNITPSGLNAANYTITYINGKLTINAIPTGPVRNNTVPLAAAVTVLPPATAFDFSSGNAVSADMVVNDVTEDFAGNSSPDRFCLGSTLTNPLPNCQKQVNTDRFIVPTLQVKNSAGSVKRLQLSANKQFLSLLLEDGSVRIWDFQQGVQRRILMPNKTLALTDISAVDSQGELLSIASKIGIDAHNIISSELNDRLAINKPDINQFMTSNDGNLLLVSAEADQQLSLWDSKHNKQLWQLPNKRGVVNGLALTDNKRFGAVLSREAGSYVLPVDLQLNSLTDAVDIIALDTGKVIKSLPNVGEQILSIQFKDNDTLQLRLANGEVLDWPIAGDSPKTVGTFAETVAAVDGGKEMFAYILNDGTARVGDGLGHVTLSIENKENPFKYAKLLEGDKKLLTVMANGELSLWDIASGKKMLRLFSTQQGWTVMDAFGRFDGSEQAMGDFSWLADAEDIPLDSFSENYYEPGLLGNVMHNQDYLNSNPNRVQTGISLPPKVTLQIAGQQAQGDIVAMQLDVYDRGGGIDKINIYHNGKILNNKNVIATQQTQQLNAAEHRTLTLNITPSAGKNTLKVIASNEMGIENSSAELTFDGKAKAYASSIRLLTIGIDQYSDAKLNLDYSVSDADSIALAIKNSSKIATSNQLYDHNATKPQILAKLKELSQGVQQDVLVIYLAGHGMALGKEWYFLPYETTMQPTLEKIAATGITATELSGIFTDSKIQHILLMVDSCYSGAGLDAFSKLQNGQRYFTRQLSRTLGITVIAAAAKDQEAFELKSLGHGLFTYLVTQEIQDKKASQAITAHGIAESIVKTLPVFSKKMLGASQEPAVFTRGNDFMLTDLLKE